MGVSSWCLITQELKLISSSQYSQPWRLDQEVIRKIAKNENLTKIIKEKHSQKNIKQAINRRWWRLDRAHILKATGNKAWSIKIISTIWLRKSIDADDDS